MLEKLKVWLANTEFAEWLHARFSEADQRIEAVESRFIQLEDRIKKLESSVHG